MNAVRRWRTYPRLGRISNLPTIATQTAAGVAIADVRVDARDVLFVGGGLTAAYVAGMFLNDAFDRHVDARERPDRPIPAGHIGAFEVFALGGLLLVTGVLLLVAGGARHDHADAGLETAAGLAFAILLYDASHKKNRFAPLVMGACRGLVYVCAASALSGSIPRIALVAAFAIAAHVAGLSEIARPDGSASLAASALFLGPLALGLEISPHSLLATAITLVLVGVVAHAIRTARGGERERATVMLLAGMSLVDASLLAASGHPFLALGAAAAPLLTRALQSVIRGM